MIIPQNAGLSTKLYVLPKFIVYPLAAAAVSFIGMLAAGFTTMLIFGGAYETDFAELLLIALIAAVYDAFIITLYFTLGLCTARAGIATVILYGGSAILSTLFVSFGADKFHPFALKNGRRTFSPRVGGYGQYLGKYRSDLAYYAALLFYYGVCYFG